MDLINLNKTDLRKKSAVIVLYERTTDALILTKRSKQLRNHPGEVCFPGGGWEGGDENLYATALRELEEELGISPSRVQLERAMDPETTLSGYVIHPWLASIETLVPYHADCEEVSEVFSLPMKEVVLASNYQELLVNRYELKIKSYQYTASSHFVWGATARIMMQLIGSA